MASNNYNSNDSLDDNVVYLTPNQYEPNKYSRGITMISDLHSQWDGLEEVLRHAAANDNDVLMPGDAIGYYFEEIARKRGYKTQSMIADEFLVEKVNKGDISEENYLTYMVMQNLKLVGSVDDYVAMISQQIPFDQIDQAKQELEQIIQYSSTNEFKNAVVGLQSQFVKEKGEEVRTNKDNLKNLQFGVWMANARKFAEVKNKVEGELNKVITTYWLDGNHDPRGYAQLIQRFSDSPESFIDLGSEVGYTTSKGGANDNESEDITMAGFSNVYSRWLEKHIYEVFDEPEVNHYFSHMIEEFHDPALFISKNPTKQELKNLEEIIRKDHEFNRMTNNGEDLDKILDLFVSHNSPFAPIVGVAANDNQPKAANDNEIGSAVKGNIREGFEDHRNAVGDYMLQFAKASVHGHHHGGMFGQDHLGKNFVRPVGSIFDVYKIDGKLIFQKVPTKFTYDTRAPINIEDYILDEELEYFTANDNNSSSSSSSSNSKAA